MKWWFAFLSVAVPSFSGAIYSVTDLGALGGASAAAFGVNAAGDSAGWADTPQGDTEAVVVTGGVLRSLGPGSEAYAINNAGQAVGLVGTHGASWTASAMTDLGAGAVAMAINNAGQIAGGNGHAFLMGAGSLQDLGTLGGGELERRLWAQRCRRSSGKRHAFHRPFCRVHLDRTNRHDRARHSGWSR
jgi:uncharacterized membrane protein